MRSNGEDSDDEVDRNGGEDGSEERTLEDGEHHDPSGAASHGSNDHDRDEEDQQGEDQREITYHGDGGEPPEDDTGENNSGIEDDDSDASDEDALPRSIWTFTFRPATPSTQANIPKLPYSHRPRLTLKISTPVGL